MTTPRAPTDELALDDANAVRFMKFYASLAGATAAATTDAGESDDVGQTVSRTVRFFDRKDFMSVHGDDATYVAKEFYKVRARVMIARASSRGVDGRCAERAWAR